MIHHLLLRRIATLRARLVSLIVKSDTTAVRFLLATAGVLWAVILWLPTDSFSRPSYAYMKSLSSLLGADHAQTKWAVLWSVYGILKLWRVFTSTPRPTAALVVNSLGVLLFGAAVYCIFASAIDKNGAFPHSAATAIVCFIAAIWILIRTQVNSESGWRGD